MCSVFIYVLHKVLSLSGLGLYVILLHNCYLCFQIKNHFSVPFEILKYCPKSRSLQSVGTAEPEKEFHVTLESYRYHHGYTLQLYTGVALVYSSFSHLTSAEFNECCVHIRAT